MLGYASQLPDLGGSLEGKSENSVLEFLFRPWPALRPRGSYPTSLSIRVPRGDGNESRWEAQRAEHSPAKDLAWRGPSGRSRLGARLVSGAAPSLSSEHTCFGSAIPPASDAQQTAQVHLRFPGAGALCCRGNEAFVSLPGASPGRKCQRPSREPDIGPGRTLPFDLIQQRHR